MTYMGSTYELPETPEIEDFDGSEPIEISNANQINQLEAALAELVGSGEQVPEDEALDIPPFPQRNWDELEGVLASLGPVIKTSQELLLRAQELDQQYWAEYGPWFRKLRNKQHFISRVHGRVPHKVQRLRRHRP